MIIYTKLFKGNWRAAVTLGPIVIMREEFRNNAPMIAHEIRHTKQWWACTMISYLVTAVALIMHGDFNIFYMYIAPLLFPVLYIICEPFRYHAELDAYLVQINVTPENQRAERRHEIALSLSTNYRLNRSYREILNAL